MEEKTNEKNRFLFHDTIISWACIIWAVASIALMFYFTGLDQVTFSIMTFGQLFLIVGLIALSRRKAAGIILTVTGISCIVIPAINEWAPLFFEDAESSTIFPIFLTIALLFIGFAMLIVPGVLEDMSERRCKKTVRGECIDYKATTLKDGKTQVYAPVYRYKVNGKEYEKCTNQYSIEKSVNIGSRKNLKVNENKPEEVFIPASKASKMLIYILGTGFTITGIGMLLVVLAEI